MPHITYYRACAPFIQPVMTGCSDTWKSVSLSWVITLSHDFTLLYNIGVPYLVSRKINTVSSHFPYSRDLLYGQFSVRFDRMPHITYYRACAPFIQPIMTGCSDTWKSVSLSWVITLSHDFTLLYNIGVPYLVSRKINTVSSHFPVASGIVCHMQHSVKPHRKLPIQ